MRHFEELEENLAGRLKTVILVILSAVLLIMYVREQEVRAAENNPIDQYFQGISTTGFTEEQTYAYALIYQECWEKEFFHAYKLLEQRETLYSPIQDKAQEAKEYFRRFAQAQGAVEADLQTIEKIALETELIREQTLKIYEKVMPEQFIFSRDEAEEMLARLAE